MPNALPNENELYERIKRERISIPSEVWELLYYRLGNDVTAINLICQYYLTEKQPIPVSEARKILQHTKHIKTLVNQITFTRKGDSEFPEITGSSPLHSIFIEMFTHYVGNDIHAINFMVYDAIDPAAPNSVSLETTRHILEHTRSIKDFINRLQAATSQDITAPLAQPEPAATGPLLDSHKEYSKEEIFNIIFRLLSEELSVPQESNITLKTRFREDLALDSVDALQLSIAFEHTFDFEIPDDILEKIRTIQDAVDYIYKVAREENRR